MSTEITVSESLRNGYADDIATACNNGYLAIYTGSMPATIDDSLGGANTLLAELRFNATAAPAASGGLLTFNAITGDASNNAGGIATFYRAYTSTGIDQANIVFQGSVGTSDASLILADTLIIAAGTTDVDSFTLQVD